ncbi:hypothetical protein ACIBJI_41900 [Nocardia sp. NPDC050408]|uniref:hypothetical protein n=1 Tax=Nocardia sp. NPDC050408 TaxID=3364319 RepID=UPI003798CC70
MVSGSHSSTAGEADRSPDARLGVHVITLPLCRPPMTSNDQRRMHWTKVRKAKAEVAEQVGWRGREQLRKGLRINHARITVTWYAPDARRRDSDALGPFLKAALDALVKMGVLPDDHSAHVVETSLRIVIDRSNPRMTITIEDLDSITAPAVRPSAPVETPKLAQRGSASRKISGPSSAPTVPAADSRPVQDVSSHTPPSSDVLSQPLVARPAGVSSHATPDDVLSQPVEDHRASVLRDTSCCMVCGAPITQPGTGRPRKTCSGACRMRASRARSGKNDPRSGKKFSAAA